MIETLDSENFVDTIFCSHEARIQNVESLLETARSVLENFDDSLLGLRHEYDRVSEQLRDNLAKNGSLRKKDFDTMMGVLAADQDQRGREVRDLSRKYLDEQTQLIRELRKQLHDFMGALADGEAAKVTEHHQAITDLFVKQRQRSDTVVTQLKESQKEQQQAAGMLRQLLAKGRELRIKDLKSMLAEFKRQRGQRRMEQGTRREEVQDMREEVQDMLRGFRVQRVEAEQDRRSSSREQTEGGQQP
jgi:gas vesicle protein